ncbi:MFS transporter [Hyphomonas sp. L-53-1-40]|uniref:MFS transporter n=1 Tax=Hyphomonas sp. L-53-1-40 TaxID=1207058 RepID=UPI0018DB1983|nr:MFS transporter [Hyphomonas sp. L-53-1-40]
MSDRIERRLVIAVLCAISGMAAMVIAIFGRSLGEVGVMMVLVVWGAGALTFFGLCVAHAIDRTPKGKIPQVMSGLLFIWAGGSIVGPLLSGIAMRGAGATGLFGLSGLLLILLALIMVWRVSARAAPEEHQQEDWSPILPTPLASVELDPRNPDREAET